MLLYATNPIYRLRSIGGHSFYAPRWADLVRAAGEVHRQPTQLRLPVNSVEVAASSALDRLAARYLVTSALARPFGAYQPAPRSTQAIRIGRGRVGHATIQGGPLRGVMVTVRPPIGLHSELAYLEVALRDPAGNTLSRGSRRFYERPPGAPGAPLPSFTAGGRYWVPIAGEDLPPGERLDVEVSLRSDATDVVRVDGTLQGHVALGVVRPAPDGLRLEYADSGATIYRRRDALPRIRWASRARVIPSAQSRVAALGGGSIPDDTVVLDRNGPAATGRPATIAVREDTGDKIRVEVDADGAGYLVVADALQHGWSAQLDGREVPLVNADHALVALHVPRGSHVIELAATPPGWRAGIVISLSALLLLLTLAGVWMLRRRLRARDQRGRNQFDCTPTQSDRDDHPGRVTTPR
jgi:hypothetical protein